MSEALLDEREAAKLQWRCRRGLVENDLFIEQFFATYGSRLTASQAQGLTTLMDLPDNDLLDLLLRRKELTGDIDTPTIKEVLEQLRPRVAAPPPALAG
ncbi:MULTISPECIES: succinate dehydrogenase assembly factor 2 [unclassified Acidovorax]|uniref:FAD assembly factor SdhE n=1 Tax=unclassified Acidovorax TaxID=2684926 RepID=UPI002882FBAD|nr:MULTISPECIES: succinate dehydrogenase assembly factor 2 [unclassified Acidovorax]